MPSKSIFSSIGHKSIISTEQLNEKRIKSIYEQQVGIKQMSLEGFFDFFKKKEEKVKAEKKEKETSESLELLQLVLEGSGIRWTSKKAL